LIIPRFSFQKPERYCTYCKKTVSGGKLKRHIVRKHKSDPEVAEILKHNKTVQNTFFDQKRKDGIDDFNLNEIPHGKNQQCVREV